MLKYYGHKCFEGLLYKCVKIYLCKSYISGLNGYVFLNVFAVEAYVASWIEILLRFNQNSSFKSKPLRLRGLKLNLLASRIQLLEVEAFAASWIEIILK